MDRRERIDSAHMAQLAALQGWQAKVWTALPGSVISYNPAQNTCAVQVGLLFTQLSEQGAESVVQMPPLLDCPVVFPGGGGFALTFPLREGDECLVVFASRCIDAWWQSGGIQQQAEFRMHDLSDGFVLPGVRSVPNVPASISTAKVQLRSDDGAATVSIDAAHNIDATTSGNITVTAASAHVTAPMITLEGNVTVTGNLNVSGTGTITGDLTAAGKSVSTHVHGGVQTGTGTTATPT